MFRAHWASVPTKQALKTSKILHQIPRNRSKSLVKWCDVHFLNKRPTHRLSIKVINLFDKESRVDVRETIIYLNLANSPIGQPENNSLGNTIFWIQTWKKNTKT